MTGLTIDNPISLTGALLSGTIIAGDTLWLCGGTYTGNYVFDLYGTSDNPITIRPSNHERVIIDGSVEVLGNNIIFQEIEFCFSGWTNRDNAPESDIRTIDLRGTGNRMIGCIIHDTFNNGIWLDVGGGYYECVIYNCGCIREISQDNEGHAIYAQNTNPTQYHHNNILCENYNYGFHGYSTGEHSLDYFDIRQNISFRNGGRQFLLGGSGGQRAYNCVVDENVLLEGDAILKGTDITLTNNYSPNGFTIDELSNNVTQSGNTFTTEETNRVFVFPLTHKVGAHIAIFNWEGLDTVTVDVSSVTGLTNYRLRNAQDYFVDVVTGSAAGSIDIDMRAVSHTVAARIGSTAVTTTFPAFGCFVLEAI